MRAGGGYAGDSGEKAVSKDAGVEANALDLQLVLLLSKAEQMKRKCPDQSQLWAEVACKIAAARRAVWPLMSPFSQAIVR